MSTPERPVDDQHRGERGQSRGGVRGVLNELLHGRDGADHHDTRPDAGEARTEQTHAGQPRTDGRPAQGEAAQPIPGAPGYRDPAGPQHAADPAHHGGAVSGTPAGGARAGGAPAGGAPAGGGSTLPAAPGPQSPGQQVPGQQVPGQQVPGPAGGVAPDQSYGGPQTTGRPGADGAGATSAGVGAAGIAAAGVAHAGGTTERRDRADEAGRPGVGSDPTQQPTAQHAADQRATDGHDPARHATDRPDQRAGDPHAGDRHASDQHAGDRHDSDRHDSDRHGSDRHAERATDRSAGHAAGAGTPAGPSAGEDAAGRERLVPAARAQEYGARWDAVKGAFVDEPRQAVQQADALVGELLDELERLFRDQRRGLEQGLDADETSTEDLRLALRRYRSFFDRLLSL
jgi:hypothetical protein